MRQFKVHRRRAQASLVQQLISKIKS